MIFERKGHPRRVGMAAIIRNAICEALKTAEAKPELYTEAAECLRDEMDAQGVMLDAPVLLSASTYAQQRMEQGVYMDGWRDRAAHEEEKQSGQTK